METVSRTALMKESEESIPGKAACNNVNESIVKSGLAVSCRSGHSHPERTREITEICTWAKGDQELPGQSTPMITHSRSVLVRLLMIRELFRLNITF